MNHNLSKVALVGLAALALMAVLPTATATPHANVLGCTADFETSTIANAFWYENYVYNANPSPSNEVAGASQYSAYQDASNTAFEGCI